MEISTTIVVSIVLKATHSLCNFLKWGFSYCTKRSAERRFLIKAIVSAISDSVAIVLEINQYSFLGPIPSNSELTDISDKIGNRLMFTCNNIGRAANKYQDRIIKAFGKDAYKSLDNLDSSVGAVTNWGYPGHAYCELEQYCSKVDAALLTLIKTLAVDFGAKLILRKEIINIGNKFGVKVSPFLHFN